MSKTPKEWLLTQLAICTARNGRRFVVLSKENTPVIREEREYWSSNLGENYNDNLTSVYGKNLDIMKIEYNGQVVWERKEPIKLTEDEKLELTYMQKVGMKYVTRNNDNQMFAYEKKPYKHKDACWLATGGLATGRSWEKLKLGKYEFIKNSDTEPVLIKDILNNCVVEG